MPGNTNKKWNLEYTQAVPYTSSDQFSPIYSSPIQVEKLGDRTLYSYIASACKKFQHLPCLGYKDLNFQYISYGSAFETAIHIGQGLVNFPYIKSEQCKIVGVCSSARHEAILVDIALMSQSIPSLHFHCLEDVRVVLERSKVQILFCDENSVEFICKAISENTQVKALIQFEQVMERNLNLTKESRVRIFQLSELIACSKEGINTPKFNTGYTVAVSPVGGLNTVTHQNAISTLEGLSSLRLRPNEIYYSYTPPTQLQERLIIYYILRNGGKVAFGETEFFESIYLVCPSILLLNRSYLKMMYAVSVDNNQVKVVRKRLPRLKTILTNSASVSKEILELVSQKFECQVIRIFGDHYCGVMIISNSNDTDYQNAGGPIPGIECSLEDSASLRLSTKEINRDGIKEPRGVLCVKGKSISILGIDSELLEMHERGVKTGMIIKRNSHNGSLSLLGNVEYSFLFNGEPVIAQVVEGKYFTAESVVDVFIYENQGELIGVAVSLSDNDEQVLEIERSLKDSEKVSKWIFERSFVNCHLPYHIARKFTHEKFIKHKYM